MQSFVVKQSGRKYYPFYNEEKTENSINPLENNSFFELQNVIYFQKIIQNNSDKLWESSIFSDINDLKSNNIGNVGEIFIKKICERVNIPCFIDGRNTKKKNIGDGYILGKSIEIKTARIGNKGTYQHELGEYPYTSEYLLFLDINPKDFYIIIMKNFTKEFYENSNRKIEPYFNKKICRRKEIGNYKLTLSEKDLRKDCNYILKITEDTKDFDIKDFLERNIF